MQQSNFEKGGFKPNLSRPGVGPPRNVPHPNYNNRQDSFDRFDDHFVNSNGSLDEKKKKLASKILSAFNRRMNSQASADSDGTGFLTTFAKSYREILENGCSKSKAQRKRQHLVDEAKRLGMTTEYY